MTKTGKTETEVKTAQAATASKPASNNSGLLIKKKWSGEDMWTCKKTGRDFFDEAEAKAHALRNQ